MIKRYLLGLILCLMLGGCYSSNGRIMLFNRYTVFDSKPSVVTVEKGDTLYSIARRYDISLQDLAETNRLSPPYALKVGQSLRIPSARYYDVRKGDTLYSIARQHGLDVATLSRENNLQPPYSLSVGQRLVLSGGAAGVPPTPRKTAVMKQTPRKSAPKTTYTPPKNRTAKFLWPVQGRVISNFGVVGKGRKNDGINIAAARGTAVKAADKGTVAYAGNGLKGFGNLILIKHVDGWITAYAHNEKLLVRKGQSVIKGEKIATVGSSGGVNTPQLHFEVRAGKKAVNPRKYLP